jgi:hypothetical protein
LILGARWLEVMNRFLRGGKLHAKRFCVRAVLSMSGRSGETLCAASATQIRRSERS